MTGNLPNGNGGSHRSGFDIANLVAISGIANLVAINGAVCAAGYQGYASSREIQISKQQALLNAHSMLIQKHITPKMYIISRVQQKAPKKQILQELSIFGEKGYNESKVWQFNKRSYYKRFMNLESTHDLDIRYEKSGILQEPIVKASLVKKTSQSKEALFASGLTKCQENNHFGTIQLSYTEKEIHQVQRLVNNYPSTVGQIPIASSSNSPLFWLLFFVYMSVLFVYRLIRYLKRIKSEKKRRETVGIKPTSP